MDWARTPLGPRERWPHSLSIAVSICLNSRFPMFVWWGPELTGIYNDAYIPVLPKVRDVSQEPAQPDAPFTTPTSVEVTSSITTDLDADGSTEVDVVTS